MVSRYATSLWSGAAWLLGAVAVFALFAFVLRRGLPRAHEKRIAVGAFAAVVLLALAYAWRLRWLCDDAFISFRYADNWARGHGLVYNPGERVEGYTNFLWTAILTPPILLGIHPGYPALALSLASLAAAIVWCHWLARRLLPEGAPLPGILSAVLLAGSYVFASFGTSGLETMTAALLVLVAVERAEAGAPLAAGSAGIAATLLHPDHAIFYAVLGGVLATLPRPRVKRLLAYAAPFVFVFVPYFAARYAYYGDFFPNTYYAKNAGKFYFSQGVLYLQMSALVAGLFGALPLAVFGAYRVRSSVFARFVAAALPVYLFYVAKIGGDFMLGRLLCSVLPLIFVAAELGVRALFTRPRPVLGALGLLALAPVVLPNGVVKPGEKYKHVADERTFYLLKSVAPISVGSAYSTQAKKLRRMFRGAPRPPRIAVAAIGLVGYVTRFPVTDNYGLVSREVARIEIRARGRPGHEKLASPGHLFAEDVDFTDLGVWPGEYAKWASFRVADSDFFLLKYDPDYAASVREDGARLPDIVGRIARYEPGDRSNETVACDLWFFDRVYFSHHRNDKLRARVGQALARKDSTFDGLGELLVGPPGDTWKSRSLFSFDDVRSWTATGDAFARGSVELEVGDASRVFGTRGRFVNSYDPELGDGARGRLRSPKFRLEGDALTLSIGGGRSKRVQVRLLVRGQPVAAVRGCNSDVVGRRVVPTAAFRGAEAELELVDAGQGAWDHLIVDDVVEWTRVRP